ncbi:MAG: hypothetical protein LBM25_03445, partial [Bacteroidales bacterium]|nr:hypothetical protein [Bacteroidales bacterium]
MKKYIIYIILFIGCNCFAQENKEYIIKDNFALIYLSPTLEYLDSIKQTLHNEDEEENFYVAADDANFYLYYAMKYLKENNISYISIPLDYSIYLQKEKERIFVPEEMGCFGCLFLYEKGKYKEFISFIDVGSFWKFN